MNFSTVRTMTSFFHGLDRSPGTPIFFFIKLDGLPSPDAQIMGDRIKAGKVEKEEHVGLAHCSRMLV